MKVLVLSRADFKGGAAKVAYYTATGLRQRGIDVDMVVGEKYLQDDFITQLPPAGRKTLVSKVQHRLGLDDLSVASARLYDRLFDGDDRKYDIVHVHDLPAGFNILDLAKLFARQNVVWTTHSMAPFTGNCTFAYECERWKHGCGQCPQFGKWPLVYLDRDSSAWVWRAKKYVFDRAKQFDVVGVSNWTAQQLEQSILGKHRVHAVQNPNWAPDFYPVDRRTARQTLGVPEDAFGIMFAVSGNDQDTRKGLDIIVSALEKIRVSSPDLWERVFLLPTGIVEPSRGIIDVLDGIPGLSPKYIADPNGLRDYYASADVIWHPSRADTSSMVGLEAQACGTPTIAAEVGGVPEVVQHEKTGLLIPINDPDALAKATYRLFSEPDTLDQLRAGALSYAEQNSPERFIDNYLEIYRGAIAAKKSKTR